MIEALINIIILDYYSNLDILLPSTFIPMPWGPTSFRRDGKFIICLDGKHGLWLIYVKVL
jgi:hypothetical protein